MLIGYSDKSIMMELKITTIQADLHWEDPAANLKLFEERIAQVETTDVIVLPEMFTTGFTMNAAALAEKMDGVAVQWMKNQAKSKGAVIVGSLIIEEADNYYNRMLWVQPDGTLYSYDKKHLFTMAKEDLTYTAGTQKGRVEYKGWKIALFVCYDLRFPAWNRNTDNYDLAIYVANWPAKRSYHWRSLLLARAIENQAYIVAVNRVGIDGNDFPYSGDTAILDPAGQYYYHLAKEEDTFTCTLTKEHLKETRASFPFLQDRDEVVVK